MAGSVPQIDVPQEQADGLPAPQLVAPSANAFGAQIGQSLDQAGVELFGVGLQQYHAAAEALAQQKEVEFQSGALKIRDQYKQLFQGDAIAAHEGATRAIEQLRAKSAASIPSKYGTALFNNNSLRNMRFVQESIDSHFEQQNGAFQIAQYKQGENGDAAMVAGLATDSSYNSTSIEKIVTDRKEKAAAFATSRGMDPETAEAFSKNAAYKLTDALFKTLFNKDSRQPHELVKAELEKYAKAGLVDARTIEDSQKALQGTEARDWVSKTMANFVLVDADREPDPRGHVASDDVIAATNAIAKDDPLRELKVDSLYREVALKNKNFRDAGAELENNVVRKMQGTGGAVPKNDLDWQRFQRLYPIEARKLEDSASKMSFQQAGRAQVTQQRADASSFGSTHLYLSELPQSQLKDITPATVDQLMRTHYTGPGLQPSDAAMAKAQEYLKKAQAEKLDPVERQFNAIATQALAAAYKGDALKTRANMASAHAFLEDTYSASKAAGKAKTVEELRIELTKQFTKPGFFEARPGEKYQPRPQRDAIKGKDGNWYVPGSKPGSWRVYTEAP